MNRFRSESYIKNWYSELTNADKKALKRMLDGLNKDPQKTYYGALQIMRWMEERGGDGSYWSYFQDNEFEENSDEGED